MGKLLKSEMENKIKNRQDQEALEKLKDAQMIGNAKRQYEHMQEIEAAKK